MSLNFIVEQRNSTFCGRMKIELKEDETSVLSAVATEYEGECDSMT